MKFAAHEQKRHRLPCWRPPSGWRFRWRPCAAPGPAKRPRRPPATRSERLGGARPRPPTSTAVTVTGFRGSLEKALEMKRSEDRRGRCDRRRGHRQLPGPEPGRIAAAHPGRVDRPRRRRRPQHLGARPGPPVHPRAHQRHGGADHHRRHRQFRRRQPRPRLRLQRVRLGAVQQHRWCARPPRPTSRKARSAPPSTCRPRVRSTTTVSPSSPAAQLGYNDLAGDLRPARRDADQQHLGRRQVRRAVVGGLHRAPT